MNDLDIFTSAQLERQADLHYATYQGLQRALPAATWTPEYRIMQAAITDAIDMMQACHVELARRFARSGA